MPQRQFLSLTIAAAGLTLFAPGAIAASPVVRASSTVQQLPLCYIQMPNLGRQNLNDVCFMGKDLSRSRLIDMVTDRNQDGVPDELAVFFKQMDAITKPSFDSAPAEKQARAAKMRAIFQDFAQKAPVAADMKAALNQMADMIYEMGSLSGRPTEAQQQRMEQMDQVMKQVQNDPFMQKVEEYSSKYQANQRQLNNPAANLRPPDRPAPAPSSTSAER